MMAAPGAFYFDLASAQCYLAAEGVVARFGAQLEWIPVLAAGPCTEQNESERAELERRASELGLQPLRWPDGESRDYGHAMLAATYARQIGRGVAFALAAFRQAFAGGHSLADDDYVLIAAAACEMHPAAVLQSFERRGVQQELAQATAQSLRAGVSAPPAVRDGERLLLGEQVLEAIAERPYEALAR